MGIQGRAKFRGPVVPGSFTSTFEAMRSGRYWNFDSFQGSWRGCKMLAMVVLIITLEHFQGASASVDEINPNFLGNYKILEIKRQDLIPYPRVGRSSERGSARSDGIDIDPNPKDLKIESSMTRVKKDVEHRISTKTLGIDPNLDEKEGKHDDGIARDQEYSAKAEDYRQEPEPDSEFLIPYPRFGRLDAGAKAFDQLGTLQSVPSLETSHHSFEESDEELDSENTSDDKEHERYSKSLDITTGNMFPTVDISLETNSKESADDSWRYEGTLIPYPRIGRSTYEESLNNGDKYTARQLEDILDDTNVENFESNKVDYDSQRERELNFEGNEGKVLESTLAAVNDEKNSQPSWSVDRDTLIPYPRLGRSPVGNANAHSVHVSEPHLQETMPFKTGEDSLKGNSKIKQNLEEKDASFKATHYQTIPDVDSETRHSLSTKQQLVSNPEAVVSPSSVLNSLAQSKQKYSNNKQDLSTEQSNEYILPYPRPGRSRRRRQESSVNYSYWYMNPNAQQDHASKTLRTTSSAIQFPQSATRTLLHTSIRDLPVEQKNVRLKRNKRYIQSENNKKEYPEPNRSEARRQHTLLPWVSATKNIRITPGFVSPYDRFDQSEDIQNQHIVPYPRFGSFENNKQELFESLAESTRSKGRDGVFILTYPRFDQWQITEEKQLLPHPKLRYQSDKKSNRNFSYLKLDQLEDVRKVQPQHESFKKEYLISYPRVGSYAHKAGDNTRDHNSPSTSNDIVKEDNTSHPLISIIKGDNHGHISSHPKAGKIEENKLRYFLPYARTSSSEIHQNEHLVPNAVYGRFEDTQGYLMTYPRINTSKDIRDAEFLFLNKRFQKSNNKQQGYMVPHPTVSWSASPQQDSVLPNMRFDRSDIPQEGYMVPYPRIGRSSSTQEGSVIPNIRFGRSDVPQEGYMVPYPRVGRTISTQQGSVLPNMRFGRSDISQEGYMVPYPRIGRSLSPQEKSVLPNVRFGRSDISQEGYMVPYPRIGRSSSTQQGSVIPNIRFGRSDVPQEGYMVPYPRVGRTISTQQGSVLPNMRFGRSDISQEGYMVPYPRIGRSLSPQEKSVLPNVRFGRSDISQEGYMVPYPRIGRSSSPQEGSVIPNIRFGRSDVPQEGYMVPYPRIGRSSSTQQGSVIPNIRFGRSDVPQEGYMVPYPRMGRSASAQEDSILPNIIFGRSDVSQGGYMVPYPRIGRSSSTQQGSVIPNIRFGRSDVPQGGYMVPYARIGRSASPQEDSVLPNMRFGRSDIPQEGYMVPMPRVGRSTFAQLDSVLPNMRFGRSVISSNENDAITMKSS